MLRPRAPLAVSSSVLTQATIPTDALLALMGLHHRLDAHDRRREKHKLALAAVAARTALRVGPHAMAAGERA